MAGRCLRYAPTQATNITQQCVVHEIRRPLVASQVPLGSPSLRPGAGARVPSGPRFCGDRDYTNSGPGIAFGKRSTLGNATLHPPPFLAAHDDTVRRFTSASDAPISPAQATVDQ